MTEMPQGPHAPAHTHAPVEIISLYAETSLHPGSGSSTGVVDLPVQRERHTGFPIIPPTGVKGTLRQQAELVWPSTDGQLHPTVAALFGPRTAAEAGLHVGAIAFGEGRLIAFPVRSSSQVFVWVTCSLVIDRLARDLRLVGITLPTLTATPRNTQAFAPTAPDNRLTRAVILEDLSFNLQEQEDVAQLATTMATFLPESYAVMRSKIRRHLVVVSDQDYEHLVRTSTQVSARIALNERKTTTGDGGNLWYEETLPRDCLFSAVLRFDRPRITADGMKTAQDVQQKLNELVMQYSYIQVGGNESVGQGWCVIHTLSQNRSVV
jgi:CRISPR-associated protein Cmr4